MDLMKERIIEAQNGDDAALASLIHEHYSFVFKYLVKVTMDTKLAEDLTQDTMLRCIEKLEYYDGSSSFSSWLITIATRLFIDRTRRRKTERQWLKKEGEARSLQWQFSHVHEEWSEALELLSRLPSEQRIAILLKHYYGYSYDEIGDILKVSPGTVKSRVSYGLSALRKELKNNGT
ncbi:RNA polymerase sigma factor SigY [Paenibacillus lutimineralis]|uniref:RNA polymerase sigma factor SigY n=1 Tax=Paenibacillus lutimineralis TaxID=2707005 RepID=A0A3S9V3W9_9BACL|nr:RNA polymerase sigma factor SigY [Paenibacillus lutimineralis]AZS17239.1 RNA polymerase sigma factor SigY [Paenibacillus lutimineralis]